jgi:4-hydroxy-2-oxoglutarate aldolase
MQKPTLSLSGVIAPIPTPFDTAGDIHFEALAANLQRWNQSGLRGYVVLGSNGEGVYVDQEEKMRVWDSARRAIPPEKVLIAGTGCESTRETITLTRRAADVGADAALVLTPHYFGPKMTADGLVQHYQAVADTSPIPILIYNVPKFTGVNMEAAAVARASQHPNIIGIKDTSGNITQLADTVRQAEPAFQVLAGSAGFFFAGLAVGAVGGILALANIAPERMVELYGLFLDNRWEAAAELQRRMIPVNGAITARFGIAGLKAAMDMLGYYGGPVRSPLLQTTESERQALRAILIEGGILT